jgi:phosphatidylethanolamine-binding protein (PEBP) family uncharacterized protein
MGQHMVKHLQLQSPAFRDNAEIPERYTCDGQNVNPPLHLVRPVSPHYTIQTFALVVTDRTVDFTHWLVWNIDPATEEIEPGSLPAGAVQGSNSTGDLGYTGPCPPEADPSSTAVPAPGINTAAALNFSGGSPLGEHRYDFTLFALDTTLALAEGASLAELETAMQGHILEQATLSGRFERSRPKGESKKRTLLNE